MNFGDRRFSDSGLVVLALGRGPGKGSHNQGFDVVAGVSLTVAGVGDFNHQSTVATWVLLSKFRPTLTQTPLDAGVEGEFKTPE